MSNYEVISDNVKFPIKSWTRGVPFEDQAKEQLRALANMPFVYKHIAVAPDVHIGIGCSIGTILATQGAIIPAAVGVDIGCGMIALRLPLTASQLPDNLAALRSAIEAAVPHGMSPGRDKGSWGTPPVDAVGMWEMALAGDYEKLIAKYPKLGKGNSVEHLGTLGGGNHFIEICLDESQQVWVMLHSGSRGPGNRIGRFFIEKAKEEMGRWFLHLPNTDLAYLPDGSTYYNDYITAVSWAQRYADINRRNMMIAVVRAINTTLGTSLGVPEINVVSCHHNYINKENHFGKNVWVTRKGAVSAREGQLGIIPGSMGARSFIVKGKGNPDSFHSCSHGAGRVMSRTEARNTITLDEHAAATAGVECRKDGDVIDESPKAYKNIDDVMAAQSDLVEIVHTLKQVLCVKG